MIRLSEIKEYYSPKLQRFSLGILREYLQYKILESIYSSKFTDKLVFMGGTALRIAYNNQRFSEDLDFDNFNLNKKEFEELSYLIKRTLELEGYEVEIRNVFKEAFHCYIKIPEILYQEGLSNLPNQKITIRVDTTPQHYEYEPTLHRLDKFDVFQNIKVVNKNLLLSQKFSALLNRKRTQGRDLFDISFLLSQNVEPDMEYVKQKMDIKSKEKLQQKILEYLEEKDLKELAKDVEPFLFNASQISRVTELPDQLKT